MARRSVSGRNIYQEIRSAAARHSLPWEVPIEVEVINRLPSPLRAQGARWLAGRILRVVKGSPRAYPDAMAFKRIAIDHRVMAGVPCIRGTRIPIATVVGMVAEGIEFSEILDDYPQLTQEDIKEALRYAAAAVDQGTLPFQEPA